MPFSVKSVSFNCQKSTDWIWLPANSVDSIQTVNQCKNHVVYSSLQASKAQMSIPLCRTFIVFLLKRPITTKSMTVSFCAVFYQLIHHLWHVGPQVVVHWESISGFPLVDVVLWGCCGPTAEAFLPQGHIMAWNSTVVLHYYRHKFEARPVDLLVKYRHISGHINPSVNVCSQANNSAVITKDGWNQATTIQYLQTSLD